MVGKIAAVVPVYNASNFLKKSIESLLNQSFRDIKIVCVYDESPDNCGEILNNYAKQDNRIIILTSDNPKGAGSARNVGLDYIFDNLPDVEYISFLDADDQLEKNAYERAYYEAKKCDADILNFNFRPSTVWEYKTEATNDSVDYEGNCLNSIFETPEYFTFIVCWSKLYKKDLLKEIRFPIRRFFEDGSFAYKVLPRAKKMRLIPDTLCVYNIENPQSVCGKISQTDRLAAILETVKETCEDWKKLGIYDKHKSKFIDHIQNYASLVCPDVEHTGEFIQKAIR